MRTKPVAVAFYLVVALAVLAPVAGQFLGQPVLLGFVETGSMAPTIDAGDGFVAIPAVIAGDASPGDVVVFEAERIENGGLTTHRVVEETDRGYVTKGDANAVTDQDGDEPPVQDAQVVAHALQVNGEVVTVPYLGTGITAVRGSVADAQRRLAVALGTRAVLGTQGLAYVLLVASVLLLGIDALVDRQQPVTADRERNRGELLTRHRLLVGAVALVVLAATASMVLPAGTHEYGIVSAEFVSEEPGVIEQGTTGTVPYSVANGGFLPIVTYLTPSSDGVAPAQERTVVGSRESDSVDVAITTPDETGYYRYYVTEYRYLYLLPAPLLDGLHSIHPWLPVLAIDIVVGTVVYGIGRLLVGPFDRGRRYRFERRSSARTPRRGRKQ